MKRKIPVQCDIQYLSIAFLTASYNSQRLLDVSARHIPAKQNILPPAFFVLVPSTHLSDFSLEWDALLETKTKGPVEQGVAQRAGTADGTDFSFLCLFQLSASSTIILPLVFRSR